VLIGVYPIVTGLLYAVLPLTRGWAIWQTTMVIVPIMVVTMVWGLIPTLQTRFRSFLNPQG
jgi:antibiotic biosynthesis monooxygenase (ABM) superfamily enzyme